MKISFSDEMAKFLPGDPNLLSNSDRELNSFQSILVHVPQRYQQGIKSILFFNLLITEGKKRIQNTYSIIMCIY